MLVAEQERFPVQAQNVCSSQIYFKVPTLCIDQHHPLGQGVKEGGGQP